eukprot:m.42793 g.42793  ORF g.42793 m.42793 type:complete len:244 (-) comp15036_c0_seq2:372-1103(-)
MPCPSNAMGIATLKHLISVVGCVALLPTATFGGEASKDSQGPTYVLEHSFGDGSFSPRGTITLRSAGSNQASISQQFNAGDAAKLYELAQIGGNYLLRVSLSGSDQENAGSTNAATHVQTFVPACAYYQSNMIDSLVLFVDETDQPQSLQISTASPCKATLKKRKIVKMKSHLNVRRSEQGPTPFLEEYLEEAKKKQSEASEPPQGFLQKYWMYLLPVYLFVLMNRVSGAPEGGEGGGGAAAE